MKTVMIKIVLLLVMMKLTSHTDNSYGEDGVDVGDDDDGNEVHILITVLIKVMLISFN